MGATRAGGRGKSLALRVGLLRGAGLALVAGLGLLLLEVGEASAGSSGGENAGHWSSQAQCFVPQMQLSHKTVAFHHMHKLAALGLRQPVMKSAFSFDAQELGAGGLRSWGMSPLSAAEDNAEGEKKAEASEVEEAATAEEEEDVEIPIEELNQMLWEAAEEGDADKIRTLIEGGANVNAQPVLPIKEEGEEEEGGDSQAEKLEKMKDAKLDASTPDEKPKEDADKEKQSKKERKKAKAIDKNKGLSALHRAAKNGHSGAACALVDMGADVNSLTAELTTPLHLAVKNNHTDTVQVLVTLGSDFKSKNGKGETPLDIGVETGTNDEIVTLLKELMGVTDDQSTD